MVPHIRSHRESAYSAHFTTFDDCNIVDRCVFQKMEFSIYLKRIHSNKLQSIRHSRVERHYHTHTHTDRQTERERERDSRWYRDALDVSETYGQTHTKQYAAAAATTVQSIMLDGGGGGGD